MSLLTLLISTIITLMGHRDLGDKGLKLAIIGDAFD